MEKVCKKHQINPARIYGQCIGCELESLHNSVEVANLHRQNENLERLRAERDRDESRQANAALLEGLRMIADWDNASHEEDYYDMQAYAEKLIAQYDTAPKEDKNNDN